jgi:glycosyltransferase involved in cell wall biosynthesis
MKVLYITNIPAPYRIDFWNELGKYCDLTIWFESKNESNREWQIKNLGNNFKYKFLKGFTVGLDKHVNISIIHELTKEKFDIYILGSYSSPTEMMALQWLKFKGIPFILNSDGGFIKGNENFLIKKMKKHFISSASYWLSSGTNCSLYLEYYGAKKERIYEYPFSSVTFSHDELRLLSKEEEEKIKKKNSLRDIVFLTVGRFVHLKGIDVAIEAFKEIKNDNVSLIIIGGGPLKSHYERLIKHHGIKNIVIKDFMQKNELINYFKISDVFLLPTRSDVWGLVINEALNFGLPVITTNKAGAAFNIVTENNGFVVNSDDVSALSEKCEILINDAEKRMELSENSKKISRLYTSNIMAKRHIDVFLNITNDKKKASGK